MAERSESAAHPDYPDLVLTRVFNAPRALVFAAWTRPEHLSQWFGPHGFTNPVCEVDARPGGTMRIHLRAPDGTEHPMTGVYREVTEPERIVYTSEVYDRDGKTLFEVEHTATFADEGGKTRLTLRACVLHATPEAAPYLGGMEAGWTQTLERLESHMARMSQQESS